MSKKPEAKTPKILPIVEIAIINPLTRPTTDTSEESFLIMKGEIIARIIDGIKKIEILPMTGSNFCHNAGIGLSIGCRSTMNLIIGDAYSGINAVMIPAIPIRNPRIEVFCVLSASQPPRKYPTPSAIMTVPI